MIVCALAFLISQAPSVGVVPFGKDATQQSVARELRAALTAGGDRVFSEADTTTAVDAAVNFGGACNAFELDCAARLGGLMGADIVLIGRLERGQLIVRAVDVGRVSLKGQTQVPWDTPATAARLAVVRLLHPEQEVGTLVVDVDIAGASIVVDGRNVGVSPLAALTVKPGVHEVYVTHIDHDSQTQTVTVPLGGTWVAEVNLDPNSQRRTTRRRPGVREEGFRKVAVIDVRADAGLTPLAGHLLTAGVVEALQRFDELIVASPAEWKPVVGAGVTTSAASCMSASCYAVTFSKTGFDELVVVTGSSNALLAERVDVAAQVSLAAGQVAAVEPDPTGRNLADQLGPLTLQLYADRALRTGLLPGISGELRQRFRPGPLPFIVWGATAGGLVIGAATATIGGVMLASADDAAQAGPTAILVGGVAAAAVGLAALIIEAPFVDWASDADKNEALLAEYQ